MRTLRAVILFGSIRFSACIRDIDGDGFRSSEDCDDNDAEVFPTAIELPGDGIDNDCDTTIDCDDSDFLADQWIGDATEGDPPDFCGSYDCRSISGDLVIADPSLVDLSAFSCLSNVDGNLSIRNSDALTTLRGFESLTSIGGNLTIGEYGPNTTFIGNASLASLDGLDNLREVGGGVEIWGNNQLTSLSGLSSLASVGDNLHIAENDALVTLRGLENLTRIESILSLYLNVALTDVTSLYDLKYAQYVNIMYNRSLTDRAAWALADEIDDLFGDPIIYCN